MGATQFYPAADAGDPSGAPGFNDNMDAAWGSYWYASKTLTKYGGTAPSAARGYHLWYGVNGNIPDGVTPTSATIEFWVYKPAGVTLRVHAEGLYANGAWAPLHSSDTPQEWSSGTGKKFTFDLPGFAAAATDVRGSNVNGVVIRLYNMDTGSSAAVQFNNLLLTVNWNANVPTVATVQPYSSSEGTGGVCDGVVYADNGSAITGRGVAVATTPNPGSASGWAAGTLGQFETIVWGLSPNTLYHVRAFANNSVGTGWGADMTFTTNNVPTLTTQAATIVADNSAVGNGTVTSNGGSEITTVGFCLGTSPGPRSYFTYAGGGGLGAIALGMSGLLPNTHYYYCAAAGNAVGYGFGPDAQFTTTNVGASYPVVTTDLISNIASTTADSGGNVASQGASAVSARGVCWSATSNPPTVSDSKLGSGSGTGNFTTALTGLTPSTLYRVRAYATNTQGTGYGSQVEFTTLAAAPTLDASEVWDVINTMATVGSTVTDSGGPALIESGICVGSSPNPTIAGTHFVSDVTAVVGEEFFVTATGLEPITNHYARAYATNADGITGYGAQIFFATTDSPFARPSVLTLPVTGLSNTTATLHGRVIGEGRLTVTARGFVYALTADPDLTDNVLTDADGGRGRYSYELDDLTPGTTYHLKAYATNSEGTRYGGEVVFIASDVTLPEAATDDLLCPDRYDLMVTSEDGECHGLVCDWSKGGAGLQIEESNGVSSTAVSTKGDYGVRDASDYFRTIQTDWSEGGAQQTYDRDVDSENAFLASNNIDVSTVGSFKIGPDVETHTDTLTLPVILAALSNGTDPYVFCSSNYPPYLRYSTDGKVWYDIQPEFTLPASSGPQKPVTSLCTDGEYVYAVSDGMVYRGKTTGWKTFSLDNSNASISHVAFASGTLYATKGGTTTTAQLGSFSLAQSPAWNALSPAAGRNINASGVTFGLIPVGNYVYWGVTNGMVTKVYKAMLGGGSVTDVLNEVVTFPSGFVGASLCSYVQTVYVGGHFDGATANTGVGAIYAIINDTPALLTDVGSDRSRDNRVLAIGAYERSLYFASDSQLWRWDLVHGGYSHFAGPLHSTPMLYYGGMTWDGGWSNSSVEPGASGPVLIDGFYTETDPDGAYTAGDPKPRCIPKTSVTFDSDGMVVAMNAGSYREYMALNDSDLGATTRIDDGVGTTLEVIFPANQGAKSKPYGQLLFGINGGDSANGQVKAKCVYVVIQNKVLHHEVTLVTGNGRNSGDTLISTCTMPFGAHLLRLTLKNGLGSFFCDGRQLMSGIATKSPSPAKTVWLRTTGLGTANSYTYHVGGVRWTCDGAYATDVSNQRSIDGVGIACARDAVWAACSGYGTVKTDPNAYYLPLPDGPLATLVSSRTCGGMPTVDKHFASLHVELMRPLPTGTSLSMSGLVDGRGFLGELDDAHSTDTARIYQVDAIGRSIQWAATLDSDDPLLSPEVGEVAVLFEPMPKVPRTYSYYVRCWDGAEGRTGKPWDEDPATVSDFLENIVATVVVIERPGVLPLVAKVTALEYIEAPPSSKATGREGLFKITVKRVN